MSANARGRLSGFTPRVVRIRNRCLQAIARRRSLPVPSQADLESIGDQVALTDAVREWEKSHKPAGPPPRGGFELPPRPKRRWRSSLALKAAAVVLAAAMGVVAGQRLLPKADAQSSDGIVEQPWLAVNDSVVAGVNNTLYHVADARHRTILSAADVAAIIFRSPRRHTVFVDSIQARADSMIAIRGRLAANAIFELRGDLHVVRRGVAELLVRSLVVDGAEMEPTMITRLVARGRARSDASDRVRFEVPPNVTSIAVVPGGVISMLRDQYPQGTSAGVVR